MHDVGTCAASAEKATFMSEKVLRLLRYQLLGEGQASKPCELISLHQP